jgi:hypothetical protein
MRHRGVASVATENKDDGWEEVRTFEPDNFLYAVRFALTRRPATSSMSITLSRKLAVAVLEALIFNVLP